MKKWISFMTVFILLFLSACSSSDSGSKSSDSNGQSGGSDQITITFMRPKLDDKATEKLFNSFVEEFEKKNPNIHINLQQVGWNQLYQKLVTGFQAGNSPDVFYAGSRNLGAFVKMGGVMSLDQYAKERLNLYLEPLQESEKLDGKIYGIPRAFSTKALIYRSDLIKTPPKTWEEVVTISQRIQKEHPDMYGFAIAGAKHVSTTGQYLTMLFSNKGEVFENGDVVLNSPAGIKTLKFYSDLYTKYKIVPNPIEYNREELPILFKQGKIAMFYCGPWAKSTMGLKPDNPKTPFKSALLPKGKVRSTILVSDSLMMSSKTEHPDAAWKFMEFLTSPENQFKYDKISGLVPSQKKEAEKEFFHQNSYFETFLKMRDYGKAQPTPAAWEPFQDILTTAIQKGFSGGNPKAILDKAVQKIKDQNLVP